MRMIDRITKTFNIGDLIIYNFSSVSDYIKLSYSRAHFGTKNDEIHDGHLLIITDIKKGK